MGRLQNSWRLVKASASVLRSDKELIVFPIASSAALLLVTATFALPLWATGFFERFDDAGANVGAYVVAFLFYLIQYIVVTFSNAALVGAAMIRLRGGDPTLADGFRIAWSRAGVILGYSLIGATVGVVLRAVQERAGTIGQLAAGIIGAAWGVVTFLAVPVLVVEGIGPVEAIRRSGSLLKRTWGEQIVGNFGVGLAMFVISLAAIAVVGPIVLLAFASGSIALIVVAVALAVVVYAAIAAIGNAFQGIYTAALYRYAADGETDGYFSSDLVRDAFRPKSA